MAATLATPLVTDALNELASWLRARFGGRLTELQLFGSWARGEATEDSDVDVLVAVRGLTSRELYDIVARSAEIATARTVLLRPLAMSSEEYDKLRKDDRLLSREIAQDGRAL
jgi:predicted nucleotidyltransferase